MIISNTLLNDIKANNLYIMFCNYDTLDEVPIDKANAINVGAYEQGIIPIGTFIKCPKKKPITLEWIMNKVTTNTEFINLTKYMVKLIKFTGISVYPTSYGIGFFRVFGIDSNKLDEIHKFLKDNNIEYTNELSEANWVYRFKISKKQDNIKHIKELLNI